jgi:putative hydrolase of the HAD superfamily
VFDEVHPVLRKIKQDYPRIKLGVVSNFDERLHDILRNTNLDVYFDFVLASRDLGIEKPNPLIFQRAIELAAADARTGILPQEALHVGDHIKKDYEAARSIGVRSLLLVRQKDTRLDPANSAQYQKIDLNSVLDLLSNK